MVKRTVVLVVALVLAGVAAAAVWQFLQNVEDEAKADFELRTVYRATDSLAPGTPGSEVIQRNQFYESQENLQFLPGPSPNETVAFLDEASLRAQLEGKFAIGPISQNQILTSDQWESAEAAQEIKTLAEIIEPGKQAMSISVDATRAVGGFVRPTDRVNVLVTITAPRVEIDALGASEITEETIREVLDAVNEASDKEFSRFMLQGLKVLAVGQQMATGNPAIDKLVFTPTAGDGTETAAETVQLGVLTLEVTGDEAERLAFAFERGSVWLTLVPPDFVPLPTRGITREDLFE